MIVMKKYRLWFTLIGLLLACVIRANTLQPLPFDQAFQFTATAKDYQTVVLQWKLAPGYYLYRDHFKIRAIKPGNMTLAPPILPQNYIDKDIPSVGRLAVYKQDMYIIQPIFNSNKQNITLQVHYQGCSENGFCYPPTSRVVSVDLANDYMIPVKGIKMDAPPEHIAPAPTHSLTHAINPQDKITAMLSGDNIWGIIVGFYIFGVLISFTPCVLPMIPILSSIIVDQGKISHMRSFLLSLTYVLGMAGTYAIAGIIFGSIGGSVQAAFQKPWLISIFTVLFIAMALSMFGLYNLELPAKWRNKLAHASDHQKRGTYIGVAVMGIFSTLVLSPCVTPPLVGVLAYISQTGSASIGGLALFVMGMGMGLPLLLIGAFGPKLIPHTGKWMVLVKNFMGVLMLAIAVWMLSRILSETIVMLLWGLLVIGCGIALGALTNSDGYAGHLRKAIGLVFFIYGIVLVIGAFMGNTNPLRPLVIHTSAKKQMVLNFTTVKSIADVNTQMTLSKNKNKPILLDFYADWCVACKEMDHFTFSNPKVQAALKGYVLLRADVT
ncbi:MAG: thiol:disulfide interchange protein, partial [Coxiella sp. (in: Bacteria)]